VNRTPAVLSRQIDCFSVCRFKGRSLWLSCVVALALVVGTTFIWQTIVSADRALRDELLQQTRLIARVIDTDSLGSLAGDESDLLSAGYLQLKAKLAELRATTPKYRFIYLMGQEDDGTVYFLVDSEAAGSADSSPPGEVYEEATDDLRRVFDKGIELVEGPVVDRWGTWVSALVPVGAAVTETASGVAPPAARDAGKPGRNRAVLGVDIDARTWNWQIAARAAMPVGLMLTLLIVGAVALLFTRRTNAPPRPVLQRLLPPLTVMVVLMMSGAAWLLWQQHQSYMDANIEHRVAYVSRSLNVAIAQQAAGLTAVTQPIANDTGTQDALPAARTGELLYIWRPVFEALRQTDDLTHFDFYDAGRFARLRMNDPERMGDRNERFTIREAERTGAATAGLELGALGTLSLRVVQPIRKEERIVGYVELGRDIEGILRSLRAHPGVEIAVILRKSHIERNDWENGMRTLKRNADWDRLARSVVTYASRPDIPDAVLELADHDPKGAHAHNESGWEFAFDNASWRISTSPLNDAGGQDIGDLLVMVDVTADAREFSRLLTLGISAGGVLLALLLGFIVTLLHRADVGIRNQQTALKDSLRFQKELMNSVPSPVFYKNTQGVYIGSNKAFEQYVGFSPEELVGKTARDIAPPELAEKYEEADQALFTNPGTQIYEASVLYADGTPHEVIFNKATFSDSSGKVAGLIGVILDITERKKTEDQLHLAASVFTHAREGIVITDANATIIDVNATFSRITGYARDEVLGRNPRMLSSGRHDHEFYAALWRALRTNGYWSGEIWNRRKNGEVYAEMKTISAVRDEQGNTQHYVALFSDITLLKEHEKQLKHIAHYDALTTLPNRVLLADRLHQAMAQANRHRQLLAVAYLDLDGFKTVNDQYGHETGDQLLIAIANLMKQSLREGDTLARLGGDEFVAVLLDLKDTDDAEPMLARLLAASARPIGVGDLVLQVSASIGVTFFPQQDEVDADQLLRQADQAMYQAKLAGKNRYHVFDAEQDRSVRGHHESLEDIRRALTGNEFVLHYQPKVNMSSGEIIGVEALIRWAHPERGLLAPGVFLPVVEDHPLAVDIGEWVIDTALAQMERWHAAGLHLPVSVNVGARQLQQPDFVGRLRATLARHPAIEAGDLSMEVLETSALEDLARVSLVIESCREIGVSFALDDFGTGYSSLTYLKRLSVSQLKIDQSFVRDMLDDPDDLAILGGVLSLATAFRRDVIAEGVETVEHGEMLLQLGCQLAQGYGIARPMAPAALEGWVRIWQPPPTWRQLTPINRDDFPLLFAGVEHRAWVAALEARLKGDDDSPLPADIHSCHFSLWLETEGQARYGAHSALQAIAGLHRRLHSAARGLCERSSTAKAPEPQTRQRLDELHSLRDEFIARLHSLVNTSRQPSTARNEGTETADG
jgi:diguanylate cyclase (GGDEF)-like protein/PAS domain S-box-containing protein